MRKPFDPGRVFEASPNPYMVLDRELRYVAANRAYLAVTSSRLEELLGRKITEVFPHDPNDPDNASARRLLASLEHVVKTGEPAVLPLIHYRIRVGSAAEAAYEDRYWSATHTPLFGDDGAVAFVLQNTVDVTELQRLRERQANATESVLPLVEAGVLSRADALQLQNEALDQGLHRLLRIFEQAPAFMCFLRGPEHVFELANAAYERLVGGRDLVGRPMREALPEVDEQYHQLLRQVYETGRSFVGSGMAVNLLGESGQLEQAVVDFVYQPIVDQHGKTLGVFVLGYDITQLRRAEVERERLFREVQAARAELEAVFESFPEALYVGDAEGVRRANSSALELLGWKSVDELQRPFAELMARCAPRYADTGKPLAADETPFARALRGDTNRAELLVRHLATGKDRHIASSAAPVRIGGQVVGAVVAHADVTERRLAQAQALQMARVLNETRDFVGISDPTGAPTFVNQAGLALMGFADLGAACKRSVAEYFVEREREFVASEVLPAAIARGYWEGELHFVHAQTGEEIPVLYSVFPLRDADGTLAALATITRDLRAQKIAEAERFELLEKERAARAQAEQANLLKDQFLATVSHELRTPLTSILGWMHMLRGGMISDAKRTHAFEVVERNARIQAQLIDDLLDVSRIISGKLSLELEPTDVAGVVSAAVETIKPAAKAKGVEIEVALDWSGSLVGDKRRLQQVLWNLLANAVKFTPAGGCVRLRSELRANGVTLSVSDNGEGISAEFLPHVFERFRQAEGGTVRSQGGLGLGLSIVRHVVEAHGGRVRAESAGRGRGATFSVELPVVPHAQVGAAQLPDPSSFEVPKVLDGMHVLIVDDEEDTREYVRALLERCNARVTVTANARDALAALTSEPPDLLVSDLGMPGEDGYDLIRKVRALADPTRGHTPAVALTAYARGEDRTRAMLAGYQNYVTKPVDPREFLAVLGSVTSTRR